MNSLGSCPKKCRFESYFRNFKIKFSMHWIKLVKSENIKTRHRRLKKRNFRKFKNIQLNSVTSLFYIKYNKMLYFIRSQKYGVKLTTFSQLAIEEIDIFFLLNYWVNLYYRKIY
uniref:Ribosomal protein L20 n=1 Tax=Lympha mucosa TaxID=2045360 RepID=A0A2D1BS08_9FLOR|nr:ribosomal protein L20 [Lympha mucosa]ATN23375.1 ribosomal protein L20 [Lympha mucosa]